MMRTTIAAVVLLCGPAAFAQSRPSDDCAAQRRHNPKAACKLEIEGDKLEGNRFTPIDEHLLGRRVASHGSLIRVRLDFDDKIVATARDLD